MAAKRRWLDADNLAKILLRGAMIAAPVGCYYLGGFTSRGLFVMGGLGLLSFFWGLLPVGDHKSEWELAPRPTLARAPHPG